MTVASSDLQRILIPPETPIVRAIEVIDAGRYQSAVVVDGENRLLGMVTDGDVRRGILRGISLDSPIENVMNRTPIFATHEIDKEKIKEILMGKQIRQLPILDDSRRVLRLETWDEVFQWSEMPNSVLLMAGGEGRRLYPLTKDIPKPMLKVGKKPILQTIVESFVSQGFKKFYVSVNYKAEMVKEFFRDGRDFNANIQYLCEEQILGTAGALGLLSEIPDVPLLVMNGDLLTKLNYRALIEAHNNSGADATVCLREFDLRVPYGVVHLSDDQITGIEEKPIHSFFVNAGIYVFSPESIQLVEKNRHLDMNELLNRLLKEKSKIHGFLLREYWMDIGRMDDYERANGDFFREFDGP